VRFALLALPHGEAQKNIDHYASLAPKIVDLSADFRLRDHRCIKNITIGSRGPEWLAKFV
jgi:N-acetyl-gamma-glutamyl-phosphate/LysW-gamma-L-alpha-aminoadipyl-6-phosphate reductase